MAVPFHSSMLDGANITINGVNIPSWGYSDAGGGEPGGGEPGGDTLVLQALGGRVNTYPQSFTNASAGQAVPLPGGGTALLLHEAPEAATITATGAGGQPVSIQVERQISRNGWYSGAFYMLEMDGEENLVIRPGPGYRRVYVTSGAHAYDAEKIAAERTAAGTSMTASQVTGAWLRDQSVYGATPDKALTGTLALWLRNSLPKTDKVHPQMHISFERGQPPYTSLSIGSYHGPSAIHPNIYDAWGTGHTPAGMTIGGTGTPFPQNNVFIGVAPRSVGQSFENLLLADGHFVGDGKDYAISIGAYEGAYGFTTHRIKILDAHKEYTPGINWGGSSARISGMYIRHTMASLIHKNFASKNGYLPGFTTDITVSQADPPDLYSHNFYLSHRNAGQAMIDTMSIDPASVHVQMRVGGLISGLMAIRGGVGLNNLGAPWTTTSDSHGYYGLNLGNIITLGSPRRTSRDQGATSLGMDIGGTGAPYQAVLDCIIRDLHTEGEIFPEDGSRTSEISLSSNKDPIVLGLSTYRWGITHPHSKSDSWQIFERNLDGLNMSAVAAASIQGYINAHEGVTVKTVDGYDNYVRSLGPVAMTLEFRRYQKFMRDPFLSKQVTTPYERDAPLHLISSPSPYAAGFEDNLPINWDKIAVPGEHPDDTVDQFGHPRKWMIRSATVASWKFGGGKHTISSGFLHPRAHVDEANVQVGDTVLSAARYKAPATTGDYEARGSGLLEFSDTATIGLKASGYSKVVFPRTATIPAGKVARFTGAMGDWGWDFLDGVATLNVNGWLEFEVTPVIRLSSSQAHSQWLVRRDFLGSVSGFTGKVDSWRRIDGSFARIRVRDMVGQPVPGEFAGLPGMVKNADEVWRPQFAAAPQEPLVDAEIGMLARFRSGLRDTLNTSTGRWTLNNPAVTVNINIGATGGVRIINKSYLQQFKTAGTAIDLTGTGITVTNNGGQLQDGVSISGGKLVLTV